MNAHEDYYTAVIPDRHTILGLTLKPFCAGHIMVLHRLGSVFVIGGQVTRQELETAIFVCAQTFEEAVDSLNSHSTAKEIARWRRKVGEYDLEEKLAAFNEYVEQGSVFNLIFSPRRSSGDVSLTSLPSVHSVRCALRHYYHMTDTEFWNMPWGLAQWDYFTIPVMEGTGDLVERNVLDDARAFADEDFRRANPHLFNADGTQKESAWRN